MTGKTRKLDFSKDMAAVATPELKPIDIGMPRPWRIALYLVEQQMQMIFDLTNPVTIGRASPENGYNPDIDLGAYANSDRGVSREHLYMQLEGDRVVIIDNESANGTRLNGEWLEAGKSYPLRHGDDLQLGLLKLRVELLTNPFG
jgi:pSer/pThr/pTyr-binding forkhead associated (FHA) protein